jgi:hypothetical protein
MMTRVEPNWFRRNKENLIITTCVVGVILVTVALAFWLASFSVYTTKAIYCEPEGRNCVYRYREGTTANSCPEFWSNDGILDDNPDLKLKEGTCEVTRD